MSKTFYENFFNLSLDLFCVASAEGYFLELNHSWEEHLGFSINELKSRPYVHFVHPDDRNDTQNAAVRLSRGEEIYTFENRYFHKNGKIVWLSWNCVNKEGLIYGVARDITDAKNTQLILDQLQKNAKIGGWKRDLTINKAEWTSQIYSIFDFDNSKEHSFESVLALMEPQIAERLRSAAETCMSEGKDFDDIYPFTSATGNEKWVRVISRAEFEGSKVISVTGTAQDVTDQRLAEIALDQERMKSMQNSKLAMIGQLSAGVAHEINNPLSIISAANHLIMKNLNNPEKVKSNSEIITKSVIRAANIITGLKKFSRTQEKHTKVNVNLSRFFDELSILLNPAMKSNFVSIEYKVDTKDTTVFCSEMDLTQILINLIQNAADAAVESTEKWVKVLAESKPDYTEITVIDSGAGLSQEAKENLFVPFYTSKPLGKGTGLGLSITKGLVESNEGQIEYAETDGHACFVLKLKNKRPLPTLSAAQ